MLAKLALVTISLLAAVSLAQVFATKLRIAQLDTNQVTFGERLENCLEVEGDPERIVCVCNARQCDKLDYGPRNYPRRAEAHLITSSKQGQRFHVTRGLSVAVVDSSDATNEIEQDAGELEENFPPQQVRIEVDLRQKFQSILGWGGAFTDSSVYNINSLDKVADQQLLLAYFGPSGLKYNFGRIALAGSDFSLRGYTYDDLDTSQNETDFEMSKFSLQAEDAAKLRLIRRANRMHRSRTNENLKLFGSPWSPPAWMKDNKSLVQGHLLDEHEYYKAYALYLLKAFQAYESQLGFQLWGASVQNEPVSSQQPDYTFNSLELDSWQAAKFVANYLGPLLRRNGLTRENFKLMVGDDNLGYINEWVPSFMGNSKASKSIAGLAFHWYRSGFKESYDKLSELYEQIEQQVDFALMTEACTGFRKGQEPPVVLGSWKRAEMYGTDIVQDLLRYAAGSVDWNLALDMSGGPNWKNNTVDSPIIVNSERAEFYKQPMFYMLAHFSRFFVPGSVRVAVTPRTDKLDEPLMSVAVLDQQEQLLALNLLNRADEPVVDCQISVATEVGKSYWITGVTLPANSINTVLIRV